MPPQLVLILLVVNWIGQIACQSDIVFPVDANDPHSCNLISGGTGQCLPASECGESYSEMRNRCGFSDGKLLICCDVVRRQCENIPNFSSCEFEDHLVGDVTSAKLGEFPFMALIKFKSVGSEDVSRLRCGAVLISKRFLLTAAHCYQNKTGYVPYSVTLGTIEANDGEADSYLIEAFYKHDQHRRKQNDIGIIELKEDVRLDCQTLPICIYTKPEDLPESMNLTVMGWGIEDNDESSEVLLKGNVNPVPRTNCQQMYKRFIKLNVTHMCAQGIEKNGRATDACQGDSGGPLVLKENKTNYLVGLVSAGSYCGFREYAGIYTIVHKFLPWIIEKGVFRYL